MPIGNSPVVAGPSKSQQLGDSLAEFLGQSARAIKSAELSRSLLYCGLSLLGIVVVSVMVDHWVWQLNRPARYLIWIAFFAVAGWWGIVRIFPLMSRRIHPAYAAKQIEASMPELKNSLMNWLQLSHEVEGTPRGVLAAVGRFAAVKLHGQEASSLVDYATPVRLGAFFFGLLIILATYMMLSPKSGLDTVRRIMAPWSNVAAPSRSRILTVSPGDAQVTLGTQLTIRAEVRGIMASEGVQVVYETTDGSLVDQVVDMEAETTGLSYVLSFGGATQGIQQPMRYRVRAGDAEAGPFSIQVQSVPLVVVDKIEYTYPAYTNMKPRVVSGDGHVEAIEGTQVKIHASANQPMARSRIEFDPIVVEGQFKGASSVRDLDTQEKEIHGEWLLKLDEKKSNPTLSQYRIRTTNTLGISNAEPVIYGIRVLADLAPEIRLENEHPSPWLIPANMTVPLELRAVDPDFGLCQITLKLEKKGQTILNADLLTAPEGVMGNISKTFEFCPKDHGLKTGDSVMLSVQVKDNRHRPGSNEWEPNVVTLAPVEIQVGTPETKAAESEKWSNPTKPDEEKKAKKQKAKEAQAKPDQGQKEDGAQGAAGAGESGESGKAKPQDKKSLGGGSQQKGSDASKNEPDTQDDSDDAEGDSSNAPSDSQKQKSKSKSSNGKENSQSSESNPDEANDADEPGTDDQSKPDSSSNPGKSKSQKPSDASNSNESDRSRHDGELMEQLEKLRQEMSNKKSGGEEQEGQSDSQDESNGRSKEKGDRSESEKKKKEGRSAKADSKGQTGSEKSQSEKDPMDRSSDESAGTNPDRDEPTDKQGSDKQGSDKQGSDKQGSDKQGSDKQGSDKQGSDKQGSDKQGSDKQGSDKQGSDKQGSDKQGSDKQGSDKQGSDKQGSDKQGSDKQGSDKQGSDKQGSDEQGADQQGSDGSDQDSDKKGSGQEGAGKGEQKKGDAGDKQSSQKSEESQKGDGQSGGKNQSASQRGKGDQGEKGDGGAKGEQSNSDAQGGKESAESKPSESKGGQQGGGKAGAKGNGSTSSDSPQAKADANGGDANPNGKASKSDGSPSDSQQGKNPGSGGGGSPSSETPNGQAGPGDGASQTERADAANLEYTKKATDMVLDFLKRQKDQPDPELLRRMGWSKDDLQAFLDRWEKAKEEAARDPNKKRELDESLRALGLTPPKGSAARVKEKDDQLQGMRETGATYRPPETLRLRWDSFRKAQQREKKNP